LSILKRAHGIAIRHYRPIIDILGFQKLIFAIAIVYTYPLGKQWLSIIPSAELSPPPMESAERTTSAMFT
jgi:hypothetical protein